MCRITNVSRSGYYRWLKNKDKYLEREKKDREDFELILEAYNYKGYAKGARSIHMNLLNRKHIRMNVKKIRRLMKKFDLRCPIRKANPYKQMMRSIKTNSVADNKLQREFKYHGPRAVLLTDITYIPFHGKFLYLSVIKDAYTTEILSYKLSNTMQLDFVLETVKQLMKDHGTSLDSEAMIHSDQGAHYTSVKFRKLIQDEGLRQSMSRRGNCWDNAPQESFFGHMKCEIGGKLRRCVTFDDVQNLIDDWMDYYNHERYQWDLAKLSPCDYYNYITTGIYPLEGI